MPFVDMTVKGFTWYQGLQISILFQSDLNHILEISEVLEFYSFIVL